MLMTGAQLACSSTRSSVEIASSVGRRCPRRALLGQHACQNNKRHLRQHPGAYETIEVSFASADRVLLSQTSFLRALPTFVPVYLFPAMNTHMYSHPLTAKQLKMVQEELGYKVHGPIGKKLACGDIGESLRFFLNLRASRRRAKSCKVAGIGAMTEWSEIVQLVVDEYGLERRGDAS